MDERLTAYCGLCCADCIPSRHDLFILIDRLNELLEELQFDRYAELKAAHQSEFKNYPTFLSVLHQIRELHCPVPCRHGGGKSDCEIKQCVNNTGIMGCWECRDYRNCSLLDSKRHVHTNLDYHLDLIAEMGPAQWFEKRKEHYKWQCKGDMKTGTIAEAENPHC